MNNRRSFIIGIKSTKLSTSEKKFLKIYKPWGVILFSRNIKSTKQTLELTTSIRKIFNDKRYPILIDQEGGRINRLKNIISFDNLTSEFFGNKYITNQNEFIFHAGTKIEKDIILSNGGRVLNFVVRSNSFKKNRERAIHLINQIKWENGFFREDIGYKVID